MKKEILIGLGGLACVGAIIGGALILQNNGDFDFLKKPEEDYSSKIEALWKEELRDSTKYSFCLGKMAIKSNHTDSALGFYGQIDYTSKEVSVYNKESNKLYIISRQSVYNYDGILKQTLGGSVGLDVPVKETGKLAETYKKNEMPIRLDYTNNFINTDPDVKNTQWITISIGEDISKGSPHHGCSGMYTLNNKMGLDLLIGGQQIIIDRECNEGIMGAQYEGVFEYECNEISYDQAIKTFEEVKIDEQLQNSKNTEVFNGDSESNKDTSIEDIVKESSAKTNPGDLNKALDEFRKEMNESGSQTTN